MKLIVGLGNPGEKYRGTRHNIGAEIVESLCESENAPLRKKWRLKAFVAKVTIGGTHLTAAIPRTFMNLSGRAVASLLRWEKCPPPEMLVVSDDVHLPAGKIRLRRGGSAGGHKGLESIIAHLGRDDFPRLRIGVGEGRGDRVGHVLGRFSRGEREILDEASGKAILAIREVAENGIEAAMNRFNMNLPSP